MDFIIQVYFNHLTGTQMFILTAIFLIVIGSIVIIALTILLQIVKNLPAVVRDRKFKMEL